MPVVNCTLAWRERLVGFVTAAPCTLSSRLGVIRGIQGAFHLPCLPAFISLFYIRFHHSIDSLLQLGNQPIFFTRRVSAITYL
jgi:hypothetical protein